MKRDKVKIMPRFELSNNKGVIIKRKKEAIENPCSKLMISDWIILT